MNLNFKSQRTGKQLPKVHLSNIKASINSTSAKLLLAKYKLHMAMIPEPLNFSSSHPIEFDREIV